MYSLQKFSLVVIGISLSIKFLSLVMIILHLYSLALMYCRLSSKSLLSNSKAFLILKFEPPITLNNLLIVNKNSLKFDLI